MFEYFALVVGLALVAALIMFCCMYFFKTTFFEYGWKSAGKVSESVILNNPGNIEINTRAVEVSVQVGSENKIEYTDGFSGIVKGIKHDDGSVEIPNSKIDTTDNNFKTTINVIEPTKGWYGAGKSKLNVYISDKFLENNIPTITINSHKGFSSIDLGEYKCDINFISEDRANLNVVSGVNRLTANFANGKITCKSDVATANVETKKGTLQIDGITGSVDIPTGDVTMTADNGNLKLNVVNGTVTYLGRSSKTSGGKIYADTITNGITAESRSIDITLKQLTGGCNIVAANSASITIDKLNSASQTKIIKAGKGNVTIKYLDVDNITVETTNGNITVNAVSILTRSEQNKISLSSTNGDITVNASITSNDVKKSFVGTIEAQTNKGYILVKEVSCKVNLRANDRGKIVTYLDEIVTGSSVETNTGDLTVDIKAGSAAFLNVVANEKSINLSSTKSFLEKTKLTPIYNANNINTNPILTIISKSGKVKINEFV